MKVLLVILMGCSGYHIKRTDNPLKTHGIDKVYISNFANKTIFPGISPIFTKSIYDLLSRFDGLILSNKIDQSVDGVLLGYIISAPHYSEGFSGGSKSDVHLQGRRKIRLNNKVTGHLSLRLVLVKNFNSRFKNLILDLESAKFNHVSVIFDITLSTSREIPLFLSLNSVKKNLNYSRSNENIKRVFETMAHELSVDFKDKVFYAF